MSQTSAKRRVAKKGFSVAKIHTTEEYHRFRQVPPSSFVPGSFRTVKVDKGMVYIIGKLKSDVRVRKRLKRGTKTIASVLVKRRR